VTSTAAGGGLGRRTWLTVAAMSLASGMVWLSIADLSILLPTIQRDLDSSFSQLQWINGVSFTVALASLVVVGGRLADAKGRRRVLWWGLALFAAGSAMGGVAFGSWALVVSRAVQGAGAALVLPATLAVIVTAVPAGARGLPIGIWGAVTAMFQGAAPAVGGAFESLGTWRAVFWINLPMCLLIFVITRRWTDESVEPASASKLDLLGTVLLTLSVGGLSLVLIQGDEWGWASVTTIVVAAAMVACATAFVVVEMRSRAPLVQLSLFRNPLFSGSNLLVLTANLVFAGLLFLLALDLQNILGKSALIAGVAFLPGALVITVLAPITGRLFDRANPRWSAVPGAVFFVAAPLVAAGITLTTGYARILLVFVLAGAGAGFVVTYTAAGSLHAAPADRAGVASGVLSIAATIGTALGTAFTGALFEAAAEPNFVEATNAQGVAVSGTLANNIVGILSGSDTATRALGAYSPSAQAVIEDAARSSFVDGLRVTMQVLSAVMVATVIVTWLTARRRYFHPSNVQPRPAR
jgi:EmrB/QacA subfamily drug resistance transporter